MNYKNYLYPEPSASAKFLCKSYHEMVINFKDGVGQIKTIHVDRDVQAAIQNALQFYNEQFCKGCNRSHEWFLAGGFASFSCGYTTTYSDVDLFIDCNKSLRGMRPGRTDTIRWQYHGGANVIDMFFENESKRTTVQFVQVDFNVDVSSEDIHFLDVMMTYVINSFDLPVCRVAMALKFSEDSETCAYIIDFRSIDDKRENTKEDRIRKYAQRTIKDNKLTVPSLKSLRVRSFFK